MDAASDADLGRVGEAALRFVPDGGLVGLGTGRAAAAFVRALGERARAGLRVRGVPTSLAAEQLARASGVPVVTLDEAGGRVDVDVDGADEVTPAGDLIKGYGGALLREKVVAAAAARMVVLAGPEKLVPVLGTRGRLPVEVVPFAVAFCGPRLAALGCEPTVRTKDGRPVVTDNGNWVLDCRIGPLADPAGLDAALRDIPGVAGTGLFVGFRPTVLVSDGGGVREL